ncbi:hypothetical protein N7474_004263 [Penicillium riverlandense]|uniref:uncharacterized protein n=1 Tax=Penicillium riverlandense TaxID=1903569 RepID=UPI002548CDB4|nr:uncharacterized protein N7474_004263 [Penicillium riverlandense]KAJ5818672.1 hypothetical protein N7474_004263 [Penicillium riverlandense]
MTGILAILLACKPEELKPYLSDLGGTITTLCQLCIANNGHLPMSIPSFKKKDLFGPHLLQICHGSPGILTLMAAALKNRPLAEAFWHPEWDQAIYMATERTWEEGLLSKGGSLCHGIAGNAYPWLLLHDCYEDSEYINNPRQAYLRREKTSTLPDVCRTLTGDFFLSRGLAFLLHARDTRPYNTAPGPSDRDYRPPDDPWSLFEGLPGTVCAWADACAVVQARLRQMELGVSAYTDPAFQEARRSQLGFPGLGGNGVKGVF